MVEVKVEGGRAVTSALKANEDDDGVRLLQDPFEEPPISRKRPSFNFDGGQSATTGWSNGFLAIHRCRSTGWQLNCKNFRFKIRLKIPFSKDICTYKVYTMNI